MVKDLLIANSIEKRLLWPEEEIDAENAFLLVGDMPYARVSSCDPRTTIREWRCTCSGMYHKLKQLFAEPGYSSWLIACTTIAQIDYHIQAVWNNPMVAFSMCTVTCFLIYHKAK